MSKGVLNLVSVGPGLAEQMTAAAIKAVENSEVVVGYQLYLTWINDLLTNKQIITTPLSEERERALAAVEAARSGKRVALVSSGDVGIYAMGALAFELMEETDQFELTVFPGITAATASAALLGAPLSHDFAVLSLSDLLCPWDWIEERAYHMAAADLCVALYNVQSRQRREGVYRILDIFAQYKSGNTVCGVVRNAFRPEQSVRIVTLDQLRNQEFDMFTTILVGNRLTERKREWMYTPRGYCRQQTKTVLAPKDRSVWVFSGTRDGNQLAAELVALGVPVVVSTATEYGGRLASKCNSDLQVISGSLGVDTRRELLRSGSKLIIDATHPFATKISEQLIGFSAELGIPYLRYERPSDVNIEGAVVCSDYSHAAHQAVLTGSRIFLATGSRHLALFLNTVGARDKEWFVRLAPDLESISKAVSLGIPQANICAMQGPFSQEFNEALWRQWKIDCLVTKETGTVGGLLEKLEAARRLAIPVIVIRRPSLAYPACVQSMENLVAQLQHLGVLDR